MTTQAFQSLTDAETAFKAIVWTPLITAGEAWLVTAQATIPILDIPAIQSLEDDAIQAITDAMFAQLVLFIDVTAIKLVNAALQSKWETANESLAFIATEQGSNSNAYKQALAAAATDFAQWVHT